MSATTDIFPKSERRGEAIANSLTHGFGAALSILGLIFLIIRAVNFGTVWHLVSFSIYGVSLILLYLASTVYHSIPTNKPLNLVFQRLDHAAIYLLIAGTYTPFMLTNLRGPLGWSILGIVWGIALIGLVLKIGFPNRFKSPTVVLYVLMGWLFVVAFRDAVTQIEVLSLSLLFIGGVLYTSGILFYAWEKLPYSHAIWHLFVLGGSITHFFSVMNIL
ncbi:MAG: hemolysin III family protein [Chloroflexota bacterium]